MLQEETLLGNVTTQQQFYGSTQAVAGVGILPSPSDSEISSSDSSMNDGGLAVFGANLNHFLNHFAFFGFDSTSYFDAKST